MGESSSAVAVNVKTPCDVCPTISVVIPCFNAAQWVGEAIDSVRAQGRSDVEIVVVDDGSTDDSRRVLARYGSGLVVHEQVNRGVVEARKAGVSIASGRFIKFLDADDLLPPGALHELADAAIRYPEEALVGRSREFAECGEDLGGGMYNIGYRPNHLDHVRKEFLLTQATHSSLWLLPRGLFHQRDPFREGGVHMGEEFGFCMRVIESGIPIRYVDIEVSSIRVHESPSRLSKSRDESRHLMQAVQIEQAVEFVREHIPEHSPVALEHLARMCWSRGRSCLRIGCAQAAHRYFDLAHEIRPGLSPVGSRVYRLLCSLLGPRASEAVLDMSKRVLGASTRS